MMRSLKQPFSRRSSARRDQIKQDIVAGLTVAAIALPQSMAYALVAGVDPKYGVYASIFPAILASALGSSRTMITGPTNAVSLVIFSILSTMFAGEIGGPLFVQAVFTLTFIQGCFQLVAGSLRLGKAMRFLSEPVLIGFTAGAGILIAVKQIPTLLGVTSRLVQSSEKTAGPFFDVAQGIRLIAQSESLREIALYSFGVGVLTLLLLVIIRKLWHSAAGHMLSLLIASAGAAFLSLNIETVTSIPRMFVELKFPLAIQYDLFRQLVGPGLALGILGMVQSVSISKAMALKTGQKVDVNQEFRALGIANVAGSMLSSLAISGSFTRSTINQDSGASSRLAGVVAACALGFVAVTFGPYISYVPKAALAGIIIFTAFKMIDYDRIRLIANATRGDAFAMGVTFLATLTVPLDSAIYLGVIASIAVYLHRTATVEVDPFTSAKGAQIEMIRKAARDCPAINILHIEGDLYFGAADDFADHLAKLANTEQKVLILRLRRTRNFDITALSVLSAFVRDQKLKGKHVLLSGVNKVLYGLLKRTGLVDVLGEENVFEANEDREILISTRDSVLRAVQIVKSSECDGCSKAGECSLTHMVE